MAVITKEQRAARRRRGAFAFRFGALSFAFLLLKFAVPEDFEINLSPIPADTAISIVAAETGFISAPPISLKNLAFDPPFEFAPPKEEIKIPTENALPSVDDDKSDAPADDAPPASEGLFYIPETPAEDIPPENDAVATTITGENSGVYYSDEGIYYKNNTGYGIDVGEYLAAPLGFSPSEAEVLIIHTHGSESYAMSEGYVYEESDPSRTTDTNYNVVRVGDILAYTLESHGIKVTHEREMFDYPNYNGSYNRSYEAIQKHLEANPNIKIVIDLHRDALVSDDGTVYKTVADIDGETCSQVMLIVGSNWSGLDHPDWQDNLSFGFKLQKTMADRYPTLARPLKISQYRYNQQATPGSLIAEIGCNGNTLPEAIRSAVYLGESIAAVLGK